jgi:hypothetical protein
MGIGWAMIILVATHILVASIFFFMDD